MSQGKIVGLLVLSGLIGLSTGASSADAGLLDRWLSPNKSTAVPRSQSPEFDDCEIDGLGFCNDCDHNPRPCIRAWSRRQICRGTYYPAIPPYCAPCWGSYPTCWRRAEECWICPQERYAIRRRAPKPRSSWQTTVPPAPPALPGGQEYSAPETESGFRDAPNAPDAPNARPESTPAPPVAPDDDDDDDRAAELEPPTLLQRTAGERDLMSQRVVESEPQRPVAGKTAAESLAERTRPLTRAEPSAKPEPSVAPGRRPRARSIEELLQDLQ